MKTKKNNKPTFADLHSLKVEPNTPVQVVASEKLILDINKRKVLDDLAKEPAINLTTSLPLSLREKLKAKCLKEKKNAKDYIIEALLHTYEDLR